MLAGFSTSQGALAALDDFGTRADEDIDIFEGALALCLAGRSGLGIDKYRTHRQKLAADLQASHKATLRGLPDSLDARITALSHAFTATNGYIGDDYRSADLQNFDIARVIDRRLGLPISLSLLVIVAARDCGWDVEGVNFPAHFLVRLGFNGTRAIIDPFAGCMPLDAAALRDLLKQKQGPNAELSASYYEAATNRGILLRLQNNVKFRQIEAEDYAGALQSVSLMKRFAPDEYRLDLDAGILYARFERNAAAIESLERYIGGAPANIDTSDAALLLSELRTLI